MHDLVIRRGTIVDGTGRDPEGLLDGRVELAPVVVADEPHDVGVLGEAIAEIV